MFSSSASYRSELSSAPALDALRARRGWSWARESNEGDSLSGLGQRTADELSAWPAARWAAGVLGSGITQATLVAAMPSSGNRPLGQGLAAAAMATGSVLAMVGLKQILVDAVERRRPGAVTEGCLALAASASTGIGAALAHQAALDPALRVAGVGLVVAATFLPPLLYAQAYLRDLQARGQAHHLGLQGDRYVEALQAALLGLAMVAPLALAAVLLAQVMPVAAGDLAAAALFSASLIGGAWVIDRAVARWLQMPGQAAYALPADE